MQYQLLYKAGIKLYKISFFIFIVIIIIINFRCSSEQIAAEIGDEKITLNEFSEKYLKKCGYDVETAKNKPIEDKISFLNSIVNTELKAKAGKQKGLDTSESFRNDIKLGEKRILAEVYIRGKLIEPDLKNYYDKIRYEIRASHILLPMEKNASLEDSLKTYSLASEIINRLSAGESFESLARIYSADAETRDKCGDLYFFSSGMTLPDFEYAVYNLNVGEFTMHPVKTTLGLHIIKLTDKKEKYDSVRISHILITDAVNKSGLKDSISSYKIIKEVLEDLKNSDKFEELAEKFSNDTVNKHRGGDFGFIKRGQYAVIFDSTAFSLKPGQISDIIRTEFGWHIIKMTDAVKIKSFEEIKNMLSLQYPASVYYKKNYLKLITKIRSKYNLKAEQSGVEFLISKIKDTNLAFAVINPDNLFSNEDKKYIIAKYSSGEITVSDLIIYVSMNSSAANKELTPSNITEIILSSADNILLSNEAMSEGLDKSEQYISSINEYEKHLLAESVDKNLITSEIKISETEIIDYYNANRKQFRTTINGIEKDKDFNTVKNEIIALLKTGKFREEEKKYLENLKIKYNVIINYSVLENLFEE